MLLIDYRFDSANVANADKSFPVKLNDTKLVEAKVVSPLGKFVSAMNFGSAGIGVALLDNLALDPQKFCVRVVARINSTPNTRQTLVESNALPFALHLDRRDRIGGVYLTATVQSRNFGWRVTSTRFANDLAAGEWYTFDLAYDLDSLAVYVNGRIVSIQAFPDGRIVAGSSNQLLIGVGADGSSNHFDGDIAALQIWKGIPEELEKQLDDYRNHPEWYISHKRLSVSPGINLGSPISPVTFSEDADAYVQNHQNGTIMYRDGMGSAFEMHGAISSFYRGYTRKADLGYLTSDEGPASVTRPGRKNTFNRGAIYWSAATGAVPVLDRIFIAYERDQAVDLIGFPFKEPIAITGGLEQEFQLGRMYHRSNASTAHEVHGVILNRYLQLGGPQTFGFPVSNEEKLYKEGNLIGRVSEFESCTIYWSEKTGAHEIHGDIRRRYLNLKGPSGELGFPTSSELDIPGEAGLGRFNTFENGSICWYGSYADIIHVGPFKIFLDRMETVDSEASDFLQGDNDVYLEEVRIELGGKVVYSQRHPESGDWSGNNFEMDVKIPLVITPRSPNDVVVLSIDVWEADEGNDDHLGKYTKELGPANAWGLRNNQGIFKTAAFGKVRTMVWAVQPVVDISTLSEPQKFWGVKNKSTPVISYQKYASAFHDVDSEPEWWDVTDWLDKAFYELVVDSLADNGNCFGMSLESIYARKGKSVFGLPIDRFKTWSLVESEFNIKHCYQVGAEAIWWFLEQIVRGNTHDPKDVFNNTRNAFQRGMDPVLCLSQKSNFKGSPHCILPVAWYSNTKPWKIDICDPNFPGQVKALTVDPDSNTFRYVGSHTYEGGEGNGGRLHYMPFNLLNCRPRTPVWDAIFLMLNGVIVILGADAKTEQITDLAGIDLDIYGERAKQLLQTGRSVDNFFVGMSGFGGIGDPVSGEILMQKGNSVTGTVSRIALDPTRIHRLLIGDLLKDSALKTLAADLVAKPSLRDVLLQRSISSVLSDAKIRSQLSNDSINLLTGISAQTKRGDFIHKVTGTRTGNLQYAVKTALTELKLSAGTSLNEGHTFDVRDFGTTKSVLSVKGDRDKRIALVLESKLGTNGDRVRLSLKDLPYLGKQGMRLNFRPGLGGLDLLAQGIKADIAVEVQIHVRHQIVERKYVVPFDRGLRLGVSNLIGEGAISAGRIDEIFGAATNRTVLRSM